MSSPFRRATPSTRLPGELRCADRRRADGPPAEGCAPACSVEQVVIRDEADDRWPRRYARQRCVMCTRGRSCLDPATGKPVRQAPAQPGPPTTRSSSPPARATCRRRLVASRWAAATLAEVVYTDGGLAAAVAASRTVQRTASGRPPDREGNALYFSRAPLPWARDAFAGARLLPPATAF